MFFTMHCKLLKEMHAPGQSQVTVRLAGGVMMSVLLCSSGDSGSNQTFLLKPLCDFKSWAGSVVSG